MRNVARNRYYLLLACRRIDLRKSQAGSLRHFRRQSQAGSLRHFANPNLIWKKALAPKRLQRFETHGGQGRNEAAEEAHHHAEHQADA